MDRRLAAYAVSVVGGRVLLACHAPSGAQGNWTLPGGRVEHGEDPIDAVVREVEEETGYESRVERLLGVDSRLVPAADRPDPDLPELHNVGIFYGVTITGGVPRPEPNGDTPQSAWTSLADIAGLRRSSLVDVGVTLARERPATGHATGVSVGGLIQH